MTDQTSRMSALELARGQLRRIVKDLLNARYSLLGIQASIPPSRQETSPDNLDANPDAATEIRSVVGNCINDCLDPMIRDLGAAADYEQRETGREPGEAPAEEDPVNPGTLLG